MGFFITALIYIALTIIGELLRPKPKFGAPKPSSLGDFSLPTAQEGRPIPVIFGTVKMTGPNVIWYGDLHIVKLTQKVKTGMFSSKRVTTGYRYHIHAQIALCHGPLDNCPEVRFDDRLIPGANIAITGANNGIVFGLTTAALQTALIPTGSYTTLDQLADAAQQAMRDTYGSAVWRVVYGFHVRSGVSDQFSYRVRQVGGTFDAIMTAAITVGNYDAQGFAIALQTALNTIEATAGGGARVRFAVAYTGPPSSSATPRFISVTDFTRPTSGRIIITAVPLRAGYDAWEVRAETPDIDFDRSALPLVGGRFAKHKLIRGLPGTYVPPFSVSDGRFMVAFNGPAPSTVGAHIYPAHANMTARDILGLDGTVRSGTNVYRPERTYGGSWGVFGFSGINAVAQALTYGNDTTPAGAGYDFGTDLCIAVGTNLKLPDFLEDPGDGGTWTITLRAYRGGIESAGRCQVRVILYAGVDPDLYPDFGGSGGVAAHDETFQLETADFQVWKDITVTLSPSEISAFRNNSGFSIGARIELFVSSDGAGSCLNKSVSASTLKFNIPRPAFYNLWHLRSYRDVEVGGLLCTDRGEYYQIDTEQLGLFGGDQEGGGIAGRIDIYKGTPTQTADTYIQNVIGAPLPGYRGIAYAVLKGITTADTGGLFGSSKKYPAFYVGTSPYLKAISFGLRRLPNTLGLGGNRHNIDGDANPAAMLYEILTNDRWGLGLTAAFVDAPTFVSAGDALATEGFGLSMIFDSGASARDLMAEILRHIDGLIYSDPYSGKLRLTLVRQNYMPLDPILLTADNISSCKLARPSWADTKNNVKVSYVDRANNYMVRVAQAQDLANIQVRNGETSDESFDYHGISKPAIAQRVASRELKTVSYPLAVVEITLNRRGWSLRPGDLFRLTWAPLGIVDMVCRIARISTGVLRDGAIKIDAIEDIFGITATGYVPPSSSSWVDPIGQPPPLGAAALLELPYALVVGPSRVVATLGAPAATHIAGYDVWADPAGGARFALAETVLDLTPSGLLNRGLGFSDTTIVLSTAPAIDSLDNASDEQFSAGNNVALIGTELIAWQYVSNNGDGTWTLSNVVRGVADTVPTEHLVGARLWFITAGQGFTSSSPYDSDLTVAAKLLAFTSLGKQALDAVTAVSLLTNSRALRPYVPTDIRVGGELYPIQVGLSDLTVTWRHRNRLSEWSWADAGATATPETGTTYTLKFYGDDGLLKRTYSALTGTLRSWESEVADSGRRNSAVRITLEAIVVGVGSFQVYDFTVYRNSADSLRRVELPIGSRRRRRMARVVTAG